ncbi:hypothetical protein ACQBAT_03225 [Ornithinimicrobium sp. Y1847]|uniref:hypothetical protein n=1 Tax=unclassified Ornithinimicrobium TaxID=2615080 RepID=UPI003B678D67
MNQTSVEITAGLGGFLVVFGLALAVWLLARDLTRRLRRMRLREEERMAAVLAERQEAARAEQARLAEARQDAVPGGADPAAKERPEADPLG